MTDRDDLVDDDPGLFDGLDLEAALIGTGRPSAGWDGAVAAGRRRRHRRTALTVAICALTIVGLGIAIATRGSESSSVYTNDGTVVPARGDVIYFSAPDGATPDPYMSVDTTGVYDSRFHLPDGSGWQLMSMGLDSDPNVTRWSFDTFAKTRWSIESERFGTIQMSCRELPHGDGIPDGVPRTSVLSLFTIDGIDYGLNGGPWDEMPASCDDANQLDSAFLDVLDRVQVTDLQSWMAWAGVTDIKEPLPDPPSTGVPYQNPDRP